MKTKHLQLATILFVAITSAQVQADILIKQYGEIVTGTVLQTNADGVDFLQSSGKVHWPASMVKDVLKVADEPTTNRIPGWVTVVSRWTTNEWAHDFKQIPATVIDKGILKDVPYLSFRCNTGGYELNIYGDLNKPACVEIGAVGYAVKNDSARVNCVKFITSVLQKGQDQATVGALDLKTKDVRKLGGLTFETTLPDEEDSYGGWWISVYDEKELDQARASGMELLAITQPKTPPKRVIPSPTATSVTASPANYYWSYDDISAYSRPSRSYSGDSGMVYVNGYTRANGTYVSGYYRHGR